MDTLFLSVCRLLIDPNGKWAHAFKQKITWQQVFRRYVLPLLVLYAVCAVAGGLLFSSRLSSSTGLILMRTIVQMATLAGSLFLSSYILNETGPNFDLPYNYDRVFMMTAYCWTPVYIVAAFIGLFPFLEAFKILFLYAVYVVWAAMPHVPGLPADKRISYAATVVCVSWIIYIMIQTIGLRIGHSIL